MLITHEKGCRSFVQNNVVAFSVVTGNNDPTTTVDTMKDFYREPLIAMSIIAVLLFLVLVVIAVCWCKRRRETIYKTVDIVPKRRETARQGRLFIN